MLFQTAVKLMALSLVLLGCGADESKPTVLPPVPSSSSAAPSQAMSAPAAQRAVETPEEAAAFARYFFAELVNEAYRSLETSAITRVSADECNSCANIVSDVARLRDARHSVAGRRFVIEFAEAAPAGRGEGFVVDLRFSADRYLEVDDAGVVIRDVPPRSKQDAQAKVVRVNDSWVVTGIRMTGT